ncbi:MAG: hypothetical protein WC741_02300 [Patescibacteria group bacterium]|jgi:hypothetical protein
MKIKEPNLILCPYSEKDILTQTSFINYCHNRGVDVDKNKLNFYEKLNVFKPAKINQLNSKYFSKFQVFPLKMIKEIMTIKVEDDKILRADEPWWAKRGKELHDFYKDIDKVIIAGVNNFYEILGITLKIKTLWNRMHQEAKEVYKNGLIEGENEAIKDYEANLKLFEYEIAPKECALLLKIIPFTIDEIDDKRLFLIQRSKYLDDTFRSLFGFIDLIPDKKLNNIEGLFRLALDLNDICYLLEWFLRILGKNPKTLRTIMMGADDLRICKICKEPFKQKDKRQVTCGNYFCINENKKILKSINYKKSRVIT